MQSYMSYAKDLKGTRGGGGGRGARNFEFFLKVELVLFVCLFVFLKVPKKN